MNNWVLMKYGNRLISVFYLWILVICLMLMCMNIISAQQVSTPAKNNSFNQQDKFGTIFDPAFQDVIKQRFPMTPSQIKALQKIYNTMNKVEKMTVDVPTPVVSTRFVTIAPGTVPPVIKLAEGYISTLVFLDETGQAWPVAAYNNGNSKAFEIKTGGGNGKSSIQQADNGSNLLMIMAKETGVTGNLVVFLQGMKNSTPLVFTLVTGQKNVDYRLDLRVQGRSPYASQAFKQFSTGVQSGSGAFAPGGLEPNVNPMMMGLLDGLPPKGAKPLLVSGANASVWLYKDKLLIRTRLTILSPNYDSIMSSADGTKVYEMNKTPMILASENGKTISIKLKGF